MRKILASVGMRKELATEPFKSTDAGSIDDFAGPEGLNWERTAPKLVKFCREVDKEDSAYILASANSSLLTKRSSGGHTKRSHPRSHLAARDIHGDPRREIARKW